MIYELIFRIEAERDLEDIQDYYNEILPAITDKLFQEFFETMKFKLSRNCFKLDIEA